MAREPYGRLLENDAQVLAARRTGSRRVRPRVCSVANLSTMISRKFRLKMLRPRKIRSRKLVEVVGEHWHWR
jgi:hypothetical protein